MAEPLRQDDRVAKFDTPLGKDTLALLNFEGTEALGQQFEFHVEALSEQENINFDQAIGKGCTLSLKAFDDKQRFYNGIMTEARWIGKVQDYHRYQLVLRPWLHLLGFRADCRIFLEKKVTDIIKEVFTKAGFNDFDFRTTGSYDPLPYCVQYRETDLAFVHRLMELHGIYYFHEHSDGKHTLVLADSRSSHKTISDLPKVPFIPLTKGEQRQEQHLNEWVAGRRFRTGKIQFNDYDYTQPPKDLKAPAEASENYEHSKFEKYDYPRKYTDKDKGTNLARFRLEAEQASDHRRIIYGAAGSIFPGGLTTVEKHPTGSENQEYLVVRSTHHFTAHQYRSMIDQLPPSRLDPSLGEAEMVGEDTSHDRRAEAQKEQTFHGYYEFQPSDRPYRMMPETAQPRIYGIQTAKVVGKQGEDSEEISTDEFGRIWVQFFWDREPQKTCPVRVAQCWAGPKWGGQFIPRIGMEVVVEFEEGDPDHPLVVGCVYNGDNKYPYTLPDNKTQSGIYSDSSKGHNGYNEFMFEDKKGSEDIRMHGEKDHHVTIRNSETWDIGEIFTPPKGSPSRKTTLQNGDDQLTIQMGDQSVSIPTGNQTTTVAMNISTTADISIMLTVGASVVTITPASISLESPLITLTADSAINLAAPTVNIGAVLNTPELNAAAATVSGVPV
jgi:type VI secretion system secreted protein VgrG